jgi:membrane-bound acyltransferase YfiQ involved in biofilm formation
VGTPSVARPRRFEFTALTVLMTLLVMYSHASSEAFTGYQKDSLLYLAVFVTKKLCGFAVPGFIFMSAAKYFLAYERGGGFDYPSFLLKRVSKVYFPYIFWVVAYFIYFTGRYYFPPTYGELAQYLALGTLVSHFYFVVVIMQLYLLMPAWRCFARQKTATLAVVLVVSLAVMYISKTQLRGFEYADRIFTSFLFYWLLGVVCGTRYDAFLAFLKRRRALLLPAELLIIAAHIALSYLSSRGLVRYPFAEAGQIVYATALLMLALDLCAAIKPEKLPLRRLVERISAASYYIYLCHNLTLFIVDEYTPGWGISARFALRLVVVFTVPVAGSIAYTALKKKFQGRLKRA